MTEATEALQGGFLMFENKSSVPPPIFNAISFLSSSSSDTLLCTNPCLCSQTAHAMKPGKRGGKGRKQDSVDPILLAKVCRLFFALSYN